MEKVVLCINVENEELAWKLAQEVAEEYRRAAEIAKVLGEESPVIRRQKKKEVDIEANLLRWNIYYKVCEILSNRKKQRIYRKRRNGLFLSTVIEVNKNSPFLGEDAPSVVEEYEIDVSTNTLYLIRKTTVWHTKAALWRPVFFYLIFLFYSYRFS